MPASNYYNYLMYLHEILQPPIGGQQSCRIATRYDKLAANYLAIRPAGTNPALAARL